ncbi:MAG: dephospho-CoA kinase [Candidatus Cloacimonetes bacterium]|nr:dephospho-CoA kinase [Candidatus Cloacimonadota bacterium]
MWLQNKTIIGITGSIASGKTTAANFFHKRGILIIDTDKIGHQILEYPDIKKTIFHKFEKTIFSKNRINRQLLGKIVFENPKKLETLNKIIHPILVKEIKQKIELSSENTIVIDAALLLDWNLDKICDYVVLITAKKETQISRLMTYQKLTKKDAISRINSQKKPIKKTDFIVIENDSTLLSFQEKLQKVWDLIKIETGNWKLDTG